MRFRIACCDNIIYHDKYYVYAYIDPNTNNPFYIGKGTKDRLFEHVKIAEKYLYNSSLRIQNPHNIKKIIKLWRNGQNPIIKILISDLPEEYAFKLEDLLIDYFKIKIDNKLTNIAIGNRGGDTLSHHPNKEEIFKRVSNTMKKNGTSKGANNPMFGKFGEDHPAFGYKHSRESIEIRSKKLSKYRIDRGLAKGNNNPMYGKHHTQETIKKISDTRKLLGISDGKNNANAKTFEVIDPQGEIYIITGELNKFCKEHHLYYGAMIDVHKGKRSDYKGWKCSLKI